MSGVVFGVAYTRVDTLHLTLLRRHSKTLYQKQFYLVRFFIQYRFTIGAQLLGPKISHIHEGAKLAIVIDVHGLRTSFRPWCLFVS